MCRAAEGGLRSCCMVPPALIHTPVAITMQDDDVLTCILRGTHAHPHHPAHPILTRLLGAVDIADGPSAVNECDSGEARAAGLHTRPVASSRGASDVSEVRGVRPALPMPPPPMPPV
jgi:hypothetical protein